LECGKVEREKEKVSLKHNTIDHSWTRMDQSSWVWSRFLRFGTSLGLTLVSVNPNLGEKLDRTRPLNSKHEAEGVKVPSQTGPPFSEGLRVFPTNAGTHTVGSKGNVITSFALDGPVPLPLPSPSSAGTSSTGALPL